MHKRVRIGMGVDLVHLRTKHRFISCQSLVVSNTGFIVVQVVPRLDRWHEVEVVVSVVVKAKMNINY